MMIIGEYPNFFLQYEANEAANPPTPACKNICVGLFLIFFKAWLIEIR